MIGWPLSKDLRSLRIALICAERSRGELCASRCVLTTVACRPPSSTSAVMATLLPIRAMKRLAVLPGDSALTAVALGELMELHRIGPGVADGLIKFLGDVTILASGHSPVGFADQDHIVVPRGATFPQIDDCIEVPTTLNVLYAATRKVAGGTGGVVCSRFGVSLSPLMINGASGGIRGGLVA